MQGNGACVWRGVGGGLGAGGWGQHEQGLKEEMGKAQDLGMERSPCQGKGPASRGAAEEHVIRVSPRLRKGGLPPERNRPL